jgi:hypothetical protein
MRHIPGFIQSTKKFYFRDRFLYLPEFKDGANAIALPQSPNRSAGSADEKGLAIRLALADRWQAPQATDFEKLHRSSRLAETRPKASPNAPRYRRATGRSLHEPDTLCSRLQAHFEDPRAAETKSLAHRSGKAFLAARS